MVAFSEHNRQKTAFWAAWIFRFPVLTFLLPLILGGVCVAGLHKLTENNDGRVFFALDNPLRISLSDLENQFDESTGLLLAVEASKGDVFSRSTLEALQNLTEDAWYLPYASRVDSLTNYQKIYSEEDDLVVTDLVEYVDDLSDQDLTEIRDYALANKDLLNLLISPDGRMAGINVKLVVDRGSSATVQEVMDTVQELLDQYREKHPDLKFYVSGDIPLDAAFGKSYATDLSLLFPTMLLAVYVICFLLFRSSKLAFGILLMVIFASAASMGLAGWVGIPITAGTVGVPVIVTTLAIADFVHVISIFREKYRQQPDPSGQTISKRGAIILSLQDNLVPISLTTVTTIIGYLCLNFSESPPFRDLGNVVTVGIVFCFLLTFTMLPLLMDKVDLSTPLKTTNKAWAKALAGFVVRNLKILPSLMIVIAIGLTAGIYFIKLDDDWIKFFGEENEFRQATERITSNLTGIDTIEYIIKSGEEGGISSPDFLNRLDEFTNWARERRSVVHVASMSELFKRLNKYMHGGDQAQFTIPQDRDLAAQYLLLYEMSLPQGLDLNDRIDIDKQNIRLTITAQDLSSAELRALDTILSRKLVELNLISANDKGTGVPILFAYLSVENIKSMSLGIGLAILLVSIILIITFRDIRLGLISFMVNIFPILAGFGLWGWTLQDVGMSISVVAAIAFGIVVDDSIHFITKYRKIQGYGAYDDVTLLTEVYQLVGKALIITTAILALGFAVLAISPFQPTWNMGLLSMIMIVAALFYDFFLLPAILLRWQDKK